MKYFKIIRGYSAEDYIEINETELEKAYGAFLMKKDSVYSGGAVRGSEILAIQPDYHRTMGWNRGYKLGDLDYSELREKGIENKMRDMISNTKLKIQYLIENGKSELIGKNVEIPELKENNTFKEISGEIANKFKI